MIRPEAETAFKKVADTIAQYKYPIDVVGHTDATPFSSRTGTYTNWELSADRANTARRILGKQGITPERFTGVVGKAATELKDKANPTAPSNRRITLRMDFTTASVVPPTPTPTPLTPENVEKFFKGTPPARDVSPEEEESIRVNATPTPTPTITPTVMPTEISIPGSIKLPKEAPPTENPPFIEKDKIFKDSPLVGPSEIFSGM